MATLVSAPLNSEPANPEERKDNDLPPKSYADAVEDEAPTAATNGSKIMNGVNGASGNNGVNGVSGARSGKHTASVLRIVDTGAPEKKDVKEKEGERPAIERQESKQEYTATGLDDTPRTPPRNKHRKAGSKSSNSSIGSSIEKVKVNGDHSGKESKVKDDKDNTVVFEKFKEEKNGTKLVSVKPALSFEKHTHESHKDTFERRKEDGLASGRKAGQRWERSAIRWAPLNVPLQRRLQTLVVLWHTLCIALCVSTFFFLCAIPLFWPLLIPYMIYCMASTASTSGTLSHRSEFLRSLPIWSLFASYFPARLHRTQELPPTRKYIFGYHPHGIISLGAFAAFATESLGFGQLFPGIKNTLLTLDSNFRIPIYRDYALAMGIASVSRESCENLLSKGGANKVSFKVTSNFADIGGYADLVDRRVWGEVSPSSSGELESLWMLSHTSYDSSSSVARDSSRWQYEQEPTWSQYWHLARMISMTSYSLTRIPRSTSSNFLLRSS
ncbi:diacylglycerol O-acyltransferase 1 [Cadophora gregata f. sp. sojae]|nr:diacylglycerol O-acyltransferase 1 [Cadophora gregata f. sp. sojae]